MDDYDNQSRTALHLATIGGHGDVVNFLLEQGGQLAVKLVARKGGNCVFAGCIVI